MSNNAYGNLGNEMRAMKRHRQESLASVREDRRRIRSEAAKVLSDADELVAGVRKSNADLRAQTRQALSDSHAEVAAEADKLAAAIRKSVSALRAEARQIMADADQFMVDTSAANGRLRSQTHRALAQAQADLKTQSRRTAADASSFVAGIRKDVAGLKAEAAGMVERLANLSRQRAGEWRDILSSLRAGSHSQPSRPASAAGTTATRVKARAAGKCKAKRRVKAGAASQDMPGDRRAARDE